MNIATISKYQVAGSPNTPWNWQTEVTTMENGTDVNIPAFIAVFWMQPIETASQPGRADRVSGTMAELSNLFAGITREVINPGERGEVVTKGRAQVLVDSPQLITFGVNLMYNFESKKFASVGDGPNGTLDISSAVVALSDGAAGDTSVWGWVRTS
jgi:hypothetical protein